MIDEKKLLEWLKREYEKSKGVNRNPYFGAVEKYCATSKQDFIHKFKIAAKEAEETEYWLLLCKYSENYPFQEFLLDEVKEIQKIINSIINTSKSK